MDILLINFKEIFLKNYFEYQHDILSLFNNLFKFFVPFKSYLCVFINTGCIYICIKENNLFPVN